MTSVLESIGAVASPLNAAEVAGFTQLSQDQTVVFTKYIRLVLPLDGFIFWVRAGLVSSAALFNASPLNSASLNQNLPNPPPLDAPPPCCSDNTITVKGSLHYSATQQQLEDESFSLNQVLFTTASEIQDFNAQHPNILYIASFPLLSTSLRFAFSRQGRTYKAAGIYHYSGDAVYPVMQTQIIDSVSQLQATEIVISNSLPIWLQMAAAPPFTGQPPRQQFPVYPSFAVPDNLLPPYASIHIPPDSTRGLAVPVIDGESSHFQWCTEEVRVTFYGLRNSAVMDFMDAVNQFSLWTDAFGIVNIPAVADEKRAQTELGILAIKKTAVFEINYYQSRINDFAVQTIFSAIPTFTLGA